LRLDALRNAQRLNGAYLLFVERTHFRDAVLRSLEVAVV
jgi:hypothetical protein